MKHLLLIFPLAACAPHVYVKENHHAEMDRSDRAAVLDRDPDHGTDDGNNGAGSASSDAVSDDRNDSDDSNEDGSNE